MLSLHEAAVLKKVIASLLSFLCLVFGVRGCVRSLNIENCFYRFKVPTSSDIFTVQFCLSVHSGIRLRRFVHLPRPLQSKPSSSLKQTSFLCNFSVLATEPP